MSDDDWNKLATNTIKTKPTCPKFDYEELIHRLNTFGVYESYTGAAKINRGMFGFTFFMQSMKALVLIRRLENK
jgi:hypothetical protein